MTANFLMCFIFTNSQLNCALTYPLFNYTLRSIGRARNASDADIYNFTVILFSLFTTILIQRVRVPMGLTTGMRNSFVLAGRSASRDMTGAARF